MQNNGSTTTTSNMTTTSSTTTTGTSGSTGTGDSSQVKNTDQQIHSALNGMDSADQTATAAQSQTDDNQVP